MDFDAALKKIKTEIKFDRAVEAERGLDLLLSFQLTPTQEILILDIYSDFLKDRGKYKDALHFYEKLLSLDLPIEIKNRVLTSINECRSKESTTPSIPDPNNAELAEFMRVLEEASIFNFSPRASSLSEYFLTRDLQEAEKLAWFQNIAPPFVSWNSIRSQAAKQVHSFYFDKKNRRNIF